MKIKSEYSKSVNYVILGFKEIFKEIVQQSQGAFFHFSYEGQLFRDFSADYFPWKNPYDTLSFLHFKLASIEMLRRRNKREQKCLPESKSYDDLILKQIVEKVGCKAPYHNHEIHFPICTDGRKLSKFDGYAIRQAKYSPPCDEIPQVSFKVLKFMAGSKFGFYPVNFGFPENMKLIKQQKAIDAHTLIGNIGGYIGLFLGKYEIKERFAGIIF